MIIDKRYFEALEILDNVLDCEELKKEFNKYLIDDCILGTYYQAGTDELKIKRFKQNATYQENVDELIKKYIYRYNENYNEDRVIQMIRFHISDFFKKYYHKIKDYVE